MSRTVTTERAFKPTVQAAPEETRRTLVGRAPEEIGSPFSNSASTPPAADARTDSDRPRSALKIHLDILETLRDEGPCKQSKIICMANLTTKRSSKYLGKLISNGLLKENQDAKMYSLTAAGLDFVNQVKEAEAFIAAFGLTL